MPPCFPSKDNPDSPHMLSRCSWQGKDVNCSEIFIPVITDSGVCCAFNLQDNLRDSEFTRLVKSMQEQKIENGEKVRKVVSGAGRGLEVVLDQNSHRSDPLTYMRIQRFLGSVTHLFSHGSLASACSWVSLQSSHSCNDVIWFSVQGLATPSKCQPATYQPTLTLYPQVSGQIGHDSCSGTGSWPLSMESLSPAKRGCRFQEESETLSFHKHYSRTSCVFECTLKKAMEELKCVPWYLPQIAGVMPCRFR